MIGLADFDDACTELAQHAGDREVARQYEALIPMFGVVWPCCRHLVHHILDGPDIRGQRILEWGCGLAIPSIVGAMRGAHMTASDQHPDTAEFLARNQKLNGVDIDYVDVSALSARYDRVWMSDVLYFIDMPVIAADAFARHLRAGGVGWLTDPGRPWLGEFEAACVERGLTVEMDVLSIPGSEDAFVLEIRRSGAGGRDH